MGLTAKDLEGLAKGIVPVLRQAIAAATAPLTLKIREQADQIAALEQRPIGVIDAGVYQPGQNYAKAVGVTFDGGYWVSQRQTTERPGDGARSWRLVVHRGRPGKEGPPCRCACVSKVAS